MLATLLWFIGLLPIGVAIDWLMCTRLSAYRTDYEYSYRPGQLRYSLVVLTVASAAYISATSDRWRQPIPVMIIAGIIVVAWSLIAARDVERNLIPSDPAPKRYADTDY